MKPGDVLEQNEWNPTTLAPDEPTLYRYRVVWLHVVTGEQDVREIRASSEEVAWWLGRMASKLSERVESVTPLGPWSATPAGEP
jgi:hypothetical protein